MNVIKPPIMVIVMNRIGFEPCMDMCYTWLYAWPNHAEDLIYLDPCVYLLHKCAVVSYKPVWTLLDSQRFSGQMPETKRYKAFLQWWHALRSHSHAWMLSSNGSGRLAGTIPLSLTYSNPVHFKGAMNPDALAVLSSKRCNWPCCRWTCMELYHLEVRPLHASFLSRWSFSQPERVSLSHGSGSGLAFPSLWCWKQSAKDGNIEDIATGNLLGPGIQVING